ncbi:MAG: hypothetical protein AVDCRST_MAG66-1117, partial [uncultured Pseudonocardia sp.]
GGRGRAPPARGARRGRFGAGATTSTSAASTTASRRSTTSRAGGCRSSSASTGSPAPTPTTSRTCATRSPCRPTSRWCGSTRARCRVEPRRAGRAGGARARALHRAGPHRWGPDGSGRHLHAAPEGV